MTRETESAPGEVSSMRVTLRTGRRAGVAMIAAGVVLSFAMLALNRGYELAVVVSLMVSTGAGMITGLGFAKAAQAKSEVDK